MKYMVVVNDEQQQTTEVPVLVVRHCSECGDELLGLPGINGPVQCEEGHHGTRPGVHYVGGEMIEVNDF